jgi:superfamily II DNA or RNA helicase
MVTITRVDFRKYSFDSNIPRELAICKKALSLWIDGCQYSQAYKDKKWDGYKKFFSPKLEFEVGLLDELTSDLDLKKVAYKIDEQDFRKEIVDNFVLKDSLRPHQNESVTAFFLTNMGIIKIPTRGGKTFVSGEIIRQIQINNSKSDFLFYVDTTDLFNQTVEELAKFLNVQEKTIGTIDSFGVNIKQVTVAMIQTVTSIYSRKKPEAKILDRYFKQLNCLIVDEIQEFMSENRMKLMKKCKNVNFLLGLSATPFKQGNLVGNLQIKEFFGGIVYEVPIERLQEEGWLSTDKVVLISHQHTKKIRVPEEDKNSKYQLYLKKLIHENKDRNMILLQLIQLCKKNKWKTLVIFNSKQHGYLISDLSECMFICGDDKTDKRHEEKEKFLRGRGKVLLASNIYKKGITLPEVEILVIADGGLEGSSIMQKKGRVLGAVENKSRAVTIDIMDIEDNYFSGHSLNRLDVYSESVGSDRVEVYDETDLLDVEQSIKEWFDE